MKPEQRLFLSVKTMDLPPREGNKSPKRGVYLATSQLQSKTQPQILASERATFSSSVPAAICQDEAKHQGETSGSSLSSAPSLVSGVVNCAAPSPAWSRSRPSPHTSSISLHSWTSQWSLTAKLTTSERKRINAGGRETLCLMCICL